MKLVKFLLICFICIPWKVIAQPGSLLTDFGEQGIVVSPTAQGSYGDIGIQSSGKIVVLTQSFSSLSYLKRFNADGTVDNTFGTLNGQTPIQIQARKMIMQPDDKIVVLINNGIYRYTASGTLDPTFNEDGKASIELLGINILLKDIAIDNEGRIIACGQASWRNGSDEIKTTVVARLNSDGSEDSEFNNVGIKIQVYGDGIDRSAEQCVIDENNKIIFKVIDFTNSTYQLIRYNTNGSTDTQYGLNASLNLTRLGLIGMDNINDKVLYIRHGVPQTPGHSGIPTTLNRLYSDGNYDFNFAGTALPSGGTNFSCILLQPDGKILIAGYVVVSLTDSYIWICRINANGGLDNAFGNSGIVEIRLGFQSMGLDLALKSQKLYLGGLFRILSGPSFGDYGLVAALDASTYRLTCNSNISSLSTDAGQCYATPDNVDPVFIPAANFLPVTYKMENNGNIQQGSGSVSGKEFSLGTTKVTYTYESLTTQTCSFDVTVYDGDPPVARCKNVTVQLDATGNGTLSAAQVDNGSTDGCGIQTRSLSKTSFTCSDASPQNVILTVTDIHGNSSTCTAAVTIEDNVAPDAKCKNLTIYLDAAGSATITPAQINDGSTDACGIKGYSLNKTAFTCADKGNNTVTLTVTDNHDNTATCTSTVIVLDTIPPIITAVVPTPRAIWPTDRKMKSVSIATTATDNCIVYTCGITGVAIKAGNFANDNIGPDWEFTPGSNTVNLRAEIPKKGVKRIYTVTVTCTDEENNSSSSTTDVIVAHNITTPASGATVKIGSTVNLAGEFWDVPGKKHTAKWMIDDKMINGTLTEPSGLNSGIVKGSYKFTSAGVYKIQMNVTDENGITSYSNTSENLEAIIVVYDPNGGYTYGGGSFWSAPGKLKNNASAAGDVSYGFTLNYYKGAILPKGETQFDFKLGDFEYTALNFDYLSISGAKAQFKGTGKITGGQSGVSFIMAVIDGQLDGTGIDKVRIKIYNKNTGLVYYDNQPGAGDAADPVTEVGLNSTIVISGNSNLITRTSTILNEQTGENSMQVNVSTNPVSVLNSKGIKRFDVNAFPNPARNIFNVQVRSSNSKEKIMMQVYDVQGRLLERRNNIQPGSIIQFGEGYGSGIYYLRLQQAGQHKELRLVKMENNL